MAVWTRTQAESTTMVILAGLRRRAVDAAAGGHLPALRLHGGAVLRQPGSRRQGQRRCGALTRQLAELTNLLSLEKGKVKSARGRTGALQASLATLQTDNERLTASPCRQRRKDARIAGLSKELADNKASISNDALAKVDLLNQQLLALRRQMAAMQEALSAAEAKDKESQARISDLGARLNVALARQVQELQRYRSDFFGRLRELLRIAKTSAWSAIASCSSPRCCSPPGRRP